METIILAVSWILLSVIAGMIGKDRSIGFAEALIVSLIFSPVAGLLLVFADKRKKDIEHEARIEAILQDIKDAKK